jgi:hypothetical protein
MQKIKAVISEKLLAAYKDTSKIFLNLFWCTQKNTHIGYKTAYEKHRTILGRASGKK